MASPCSATPRRGFNQAACGSPRSAFSESSGHYMPSGASGACGCRSWQHRGRGRVRLLPEQHDPLPKACRRPRGFDLARRHVMYCLEEKHVRGNHEQLAESLLEGNLWRSVTDVECVAWRPGTRTWNRINRLLEDRQSSGPGWKFREARWAGPKGTPGSRVRTAFTPARSSPTSTRAAGGISAAEIAEIRAP